MHLRKEVSRLEEERITSHKKALKAKRQFQKLKAQPIENQQKMILLSKNFHIKPLSDSESETSIHKKGNLRSFPNKTPRIRARERDFGKALKQNSQSIAKLTDMLMQKNQIIADFNKKQLEWQHDKEILQKTNAQFQRQIDRQKHKFESLTKDLQIFENNIENIVRSKLSKRVPCILWYF